ncbi:electron transfer flavoprotein beta subunit lysine methyltransferase [Sphaerodactylus townsendi]|uniref:electron transfer flavoprotein beta subunit lysine methyltransferase n=1 Tax=Sphaerodactylus townsendi TaxID=933632 RepID=UPI0020272F82|nr:electron transfer flavoprotein beta subunit lysine methyltransferase [Sphaerodactylus townsendi]XP_048355057.1 electron transfer flavoprotein beta subunit lysine methyltransferase [Sphaerodactylus townsendi]XP_048355058.1 electron transfer flavoprotein beta subunit lysine methyltransferase [Sphaerodactylus townsendi]XP_048355059.1 electron transfer flavoprotein beta subunit lysine methyltransferase [Sphaerodactylus townsendi]XP_048355060.1 electron transfer flavoprotein beta subunit lysine m
MISWGWRSQIHWCSKYVFGNISGQKNRSLRSLSRCCHQKTSGSCLDPEIRTFLEENTEIISCGNLTPEIRLRLLTPRCRFWKEKAALWPYKDPYWAIYWPGGQGLSRYLLDNPSVVRTKSVLDLGSGCGATAIAAVMSGATEVVANDVDPIAGAALMLNCELNNLHPFPFLTGNLIGSDVCKWDVVVLGDMFYSEELANSLHQWLKKCICAHGTKVLIGDPGRPHFVSHQIQSQLHKITEYALPESTQQENYGSASTLVWNYRP